MKGVRIFILGVLFLACSLAAQAHPLDITYIQATVRRMDLDVSLQLNVHAAQRFAGLTEPFRTQADVARHEKEVFAATLGSANWNFRGEPCRWERPQVNFNETGQGQQLEVRAIARCPGIQEGGSADLEVKLPFLARASTSYKALGRVLRSGTESTFLADPKNRDIIVSLSPSASFVDFIRMGIEHIGAVPNQWLGPEGLHWPEGIDHILFVLALVMTGGSMRSLVKTISGFTVGHSITLALSAMNFVHIPSRWIEVIIALSIVYVAMEAFLLRFSRHQWRVAACFGVFHGFGFASALRELNLSQNNLLEAIVGFNVGVEAGQLLIIISVVPFLFLLKTRPTAHYQLTLRAAALCIALAGSYWAVQRTFS